MDLIATAEAAKRIGVSRNTLLRWISDGEVPDVARDWRGWRVWLPEDVARVRAFREAYHRRLAEERRGGGVDKRTYAQAAAASMGRFGRGLAAGRRES